MLSSAYANDIPGFPLPLGSSVNGVLVPNTDPDHVYAVSLAGGEEISATLDYQRDSSLKNYLTFAILAPNSTTILSESGYQQLICSSIVDLPARFIYTAPTSGTYYVWVHKPVSVVINMPYTLKVERTGTPPITENPYSDVPLTHPYRAAILHLTQTDIVSGYADGTFRPQQSVFRAQIAKMIDGAMGIPVTEATPYRFSDLGPDGPSLYPHEYVGAAAARGILLGYTDNTFRPYRDVTRAQAITIAVRAARNLKPGLLSAPPTGFVSAHGKFDPTHGATMAWAQYNGLLHGLQGYDKAAWDPWAKMSRGEVAQLLWNLMQK